MLRAGVAKVRSERSERRADVCCGLREKLWCFRELSSCNPAECVLANVMAAVVVGIARSPSFLEMGSARSGDAIPRLGVSSLRRVAGRYSDFDVSVCLFSQWRRFESCRIASFPSKIKIKPPLLLSGDNYARRYRPRLGIRVGLCALR